RTPDGQLSELIEGHRGIGGRVRSRIEGRYRVCVIPTEQVAGQEDVLRERLRAGEHGDPALEDSSSRIRADRIDRARHARTDLRDDPDGDGQQPGGRWGKAAGAER